MRRKRRSFWLLVFSILSLATLTYIIFSFPPNHQLLITTYRLPITVVFFPLIFLFIFSFVSYVLNHYRRGLFFALLITTYLLLRFFHLMHVFFLILLLALFFTLELLFTKKK
ncbi:MAG: hypothetical protein AAB600_02505 [Patescibacteria group bacterium]